MIDREAPMTLLVGREDTKAILLVIPLGYATFDGAEFSQLQKLAEEKGMWISVLQENEEELTFGEILATVRSL